MNKWNRISAAIDEMKEQKLYRTMTAFESPQMSKVTVDNQTYRLFASNSYLDLCNDKDIVQAAKEALEQYGVGSGGSRLTTGTASPHVELERTIARFKHREAALCYNTGYMANVGIISALVGKEDVIYSDELNHASIIDGARLSKAKIVIYKHNDFVDLEEKIKANQGQYGMIVSDAVFSMDGDIVDLPKLVALAKKYDLLSMVDEAHSTGVIGESGRGVEEYFDMTGEVDVLMGTLSKAVGVEGGFVCGNKLLIDYLVNKSRSFIFSTAFSPAMAAAANAGFQKIENNPQLVRKLQDNIKYFCNCLNEVGIFINSETAIIPIVIGEESAAMKIMDKLRESAYYISAIRYPTVARNSARLRVALMSSHTHEELSMLAMKLGELLKESKNEQ